MHHALLTDILLLLATAVVFVVVFQRLWLPPVLAYLFVGVAVGPAALGWVDQSAAISILGEVGIAFLLFSIGLEFSLPQLMSLRSLLLGLGAIQVLVGTIGGALVAWWIGIPPGAAIIVGGALTMSSTAIVVKQLTDQGEIQARHGRLALGILLFQDLAAVPFMVAIPLLAADTRVLGVSLLLTLAKAFMAIAIVLALGRWASRPLFFEVARAHSAELFTLAVLLVSLFAAWITSLLGLSLILGAFLAGMMLSETEYRHQIEGELRPFKDILLGLFFVTLGMQLDLSTLPMVWPWVVLLVLGLVIGKGGVIFLLVWWFEHDSRLAARTGLVLAHGGEFSLALLALALTTGLVDHENSQPILSAIIVSMVIATLFARMNERLTSWMRKGETRTDDHTVAQINELAVALQNRSGHVILCGYGRVGSQLTDVLSSQSLPWVAIDLHSAVVKKAWEDGEQVFYGDASRPEILHALGIQRARALLICFDHEPTTLKIIHHARRLAHNVPILARCRDEADAEILSNAGATQAIPETLQTSLMLGINLLSLLGFSEESIGDCFSRGQRTHASSRK